MTDVKKTTDTKEKQKNETKTFEIKEVDKKEQEKRKQKVATKRKEKIQALAKAILSVPGWEDILKSCETQQEFETKLALMEVTLSAQTTFNLKAIYTSNKKQTSSVQKEGDLKNKGDSKQQDEKKSFTFDSKLIEDTLTHILADPNAYSPYDSDDQFLGPGSDNDLTDILIFRNWSFNNTDDHDLDSASRTNRLVLKMDGGTGGLSLVRMDARTSNDFKYDVTQDFAFHWRFHGAASINAPTTRPTAVATGLDSKTFFSQGYFTNVQPVAGQTRALVVDTNTGILGTAVWNTNDAKQLMNYADIHRVIWNPDTTRYIQSRNLNIIFVGFVPFAINEGSINDSNHLNNNFKDRAVLHFRGAFTQLNPSNSVPSFYYEKNLLNGYEDRFRTSPALDLDLGTTIGQGSFLIRQLDGATIKIFSPTYGTFYRIRREGNTDEDGATFPDEWNDDEYGTLWRDEGMQGDEFLITQHSSSTSTAPRFVITEKLTNKEVYYPRSPNPDDGELDEINVPFLIDITGAHRNNGSSIVQFLFSTMLAGGTAVKQNGVKVGAFKIGNQFVSPGMVWSGGFDTDDRMSARGYNLIFDNSNAFKKRFGHAIVIQQLSPYMKAMKFFFDNPLSCCLKIFPAQADFTITSTDVEAKGQQLALCTDLGMNGSTPTCDQLVCGDCKVLDGIPETSPTETTTKDGIPVVTKSFCGNATDIKSEACGCVNRDNIAAAARQSQLIAQKHCFNGACSDSDSYRTTGQLAPCNNDICIQIQNAEGKNFAFDNNTQSCTVGGSGSGTGTVGPGSTPPPPPPGSTTGITIFGLPLVTFLIIVGAILLFIILLFFLFRRSSRNRT